MTNVGAEYISNNVGGNWLYIDNFRVGNQNDIQQRLEDNNYPILLDNRIFDLFGREHTQKSTLNTGIYYKNGRLIFILKEQ